MPTEADDVINEALDSIGVSPIGDLDDGSQAAIVARRQYDPLLRSLHAAAPWNFARRQRQLDLRGDASGQYINNKLVPVPWSYLYEWPNDCVHMRYVLDLGAYALDESGAPLYAQPAWNRPAPFLVTDAPLPNDVNGSWSEVEGHSPESTRVIVCNQLGAVAVYTGLVQYPAAWDPGFRQAFVASLAARLAMAVIEDKRVALAVRNDQLKIASETLIEARVRDGNEGWTIQDHTPDWIRARTNSGAWYDRNGYGSGWQTEDAGGVY